MKNLFSVSGMATFMWFFPLFWQSQQTENEEQLNL
jgi:hypothetical protein